jgi:uncharacterized membrane protein YeaQ/YmgE (transglycosylase-associated protein family)
MELLFVALGGTVAGLAARYLMPGRSTQGSVLVPAIGTAVASLVWVLLTWLGWAYDGGWIWWVSLTVAVLASVASTLVLTRTRSASDKRMLDTLMSGTSVPLR